MAAGKTVSGRDQIHSGKKLMLDAEVGTSGWLATRSPCCNAIFVAFIATPSNTTPPSTKRQSAMLMTKLIAGLIA